MGYWVLKMEDVDNPGDETIALFKTEEEAEKQAVSEILIQLSYWDMSDPDAADLARLINNLASNGDWNEARREWNDSDVDHNFYWYVWEAEVQTSADKPYLLSASFLNNVDEDEEEEESSPAPKTQATPFQASTPGAHCRGSHKEWNEYAYADQPDGTYLCQQCRMFNQVFGGIPKP
jgi:hypothetical protein